MKPIYGKLLFTVLFAMLFTGCGSDTVSTQSDSQAPVSQITATPIPTNTPTPVPTSTPAPTSTPTPIPTSTPTPVPADTEAPALTLLGDSVTNVIARSEYIEPGYTAMDNRDGDITGEVYIDGTVDVNLCGSYTLEYHVSDAAGNHSTVERVIHVVQPETVIPEEKVIYLTFDDGPSLHTEKLLSLLEQYNIKATFFVCDTGRPKLITKIHEAGHTIGIHCKSHDYNVVYKSEDAYFADLFAMQDIVYKQIGISPTLIRFPGGSSNKVSSFNPGIMTRLTQQVEQQGFQYFDWNVSSGDAGTKITEEILAKLKKETKGKSYAVVLMHAESKKYSYDAVEDYILWALDNGYTFLPLDPTSPKTHHKINN